MKFNMLQVYKKERNMKLALAQYYLNKYDEEEGLSWIWRALLEVYMIQLSLKHCGIIYDGPTHV